MMGDIIDASSSAVPHQYRRQPLVIGFYDLQSIDHLIPIKPLWPGFAINTVFYAAILWVLHVAPGFVRRRIRARRSLCPACAYPTGTSPVCTECGAAVTPRPASPIMNQK